MKGEVASGATLLDPNEIEGLRHSIRTHAELNNLEDASIRSGFAWARRSRKLKRELCSVSGRLLLHHRLFSDVWSWAGTLRIREKNRAVAPHAIQEEPCKVVLDTTYWIAHKSFLLPEIAVRFHHRLVFVHPFPNGNGRHARIAADLLLEFHGQPALTWGRNVRVAPDMVRSAYISALKKADGGQYDDLVKFAQS